MKYSVTKREISIKKANPDPIILHSLDVTVLIFSGISLKSPPITSFKESSIAICKSLPKFGTSCNFRFPSLSTSQSKTPGCRLNILGNALIGTECLVAIELDFTPEICINGKSGGFPRERRTADASAMLPFSKSISIVTVPSVALTSDVLTCPNLLRALIASDAQ